MARTRSIPTPPYRPSSLYGFAMRRISAVAYHEACAAFFLSELSPRAPFWRWPARPLRLRRGPRRCLRLSAAPAQRRRRPRRSRRLRRPPPAAARATPTPPPPPPPAVRLRRRRRRARCDVARRATCTRPRYSLWLGGRLGLLGYGGGMYSNPNAGTTRRRANFVTNGLAARGRRRRAHRAALHPVPRGRAGPRRRRAPLRRRRRRRAGTSFVGIGLRLLAGDVNNVSLRERPVVRLPQAPGVERRRDVERDGVRVPARSASAPTSGSRATSRCRRC